MTHLQRTSRPGQRSGVDLVRRSGAVLVALLTAAPLVAASPATAVSAAGVEGFVFQDFDSDGVYDTAEVIGQAVDVPVEGIEVKVYDASGAMVGSATSAADGSYSIDTTLDPGDKVRVEFTIPSTGPLSTFRSSFVGPDSGTTVQFTSVPATDVDLGVLVPGEYCQANPNLVISRLCAGTDAAVDSSSSVWVTQYDGGPFTAANSYNSLYSNWSATTAATKNDTGSILGMAWDPLTGRVYNSAYIRRHAELYEVNGSPAVGGIFVTTPNGTSATDGLGGTTQFLVNLEDLLADDQFSNSNSAGPGYIPTNAAREIQYMMNGTPDGGADDQGTDGDLLDGQVGVWEEVGKAGIGDIEVDDAGNLYVVSLYTKHLYQVAMPDDGSAPTTMASLGDITEGVTCTNGAARPFSVKNWRGKLYLGVVCDGESGFDTTALDSRQDQDLSFTIRTYDLASGTWDTFFGPYGLDQIGTKGWADIGVTGPGSLHWGPWSDYFPADSSLPSVLKTRPSPMLSELEFDRNGSIVLSFRDRTGDQMSARDAEQVQGQNTGLVTGSGDVYRLCRTGAGYTGADYTFEGQSAECPQSTDPLIGNGIEFFFGDAYNRLNPSGAWHGEVSSGMTELVPGFDELVMSAYDPADMDYTSFTFYTGGVSYLDVDGGGRVPGLPNVGSGVIFYTRTAGPASNPNKGGGFDKVNGMSDIEALCDSAPLQIGNRIWIDIDRDGIQDADDPGIAGVTVNLYDTTGTLVGTAVTNADGEYYFSSNLGTDDDPTDHFGGGLEPNATFNVRLDNPADFSEGGPLFGSMVTTDFALAENGANSTSVDSNCTIVDGQPDMAVDEHMPGNNDHTFDCGFIPIVKVCGHLWLDVNGDGVNDASDQPVPGATLTLFLADGVTPAVDLDGLPLAPIISDASGEYCFENLPAGRYVVKVIPPLGYSLIDPSTTFLVSLDLLTPGASDLSLSFGFFEGGLLPPAGAAHAQLLMLLAMASILLGSGIGVALRRRRTT